MKVNRDGSGTIMLKVHVSDEAAKQVAAAVGESIEDASVGKSFYDEERVRNLARLFGPGVAFVSGKESVRADGWKGFVAWYAFDDVSKVTLCPDAGDAVMSVQKRGGQIPDALPGYSFSFEKGDGVSVLTIKQPPAEAAPPAEGEADKDGVVGDFTEIDESEMSRLGKVMDSRMIADLAARMLDSIKGKKDSVLVTLDGEIIESNAKYMPRSTQNVILLYHMDFDKILGSEQGRKSMNSGARPLDLVAAGVPGVMVEERTKVITARFR